MRAYHPDAWLLLQWRWQSPVQEPWIRRVRCPASLELLLMGDVLHEPTPAVNPQGIWPSDRRIPGCFPALWRFAYCARCACDSVAESLPRTATPRSATASPCS